MVWWSKFDQIHPQAWRLHGGRSESGSMDEAKLQEYCERLGVAANVSSSDLERAHMRKAFAARQADDFEKVALLKEAFKALQPLVQEREQAAVRQSRQVARQSKAQRELEAMAAKQEQELYGSVPSDWDPRISL